MSKKALVVDKNSLEHLCHYLVNEIGGVKDTVTMFTEDLFIEGIEYRLVDRSICETDTSTLQIIPYVTLIDPDTLEVFVYSRGKEGGESRLIGNCSLGLGGHIELAPDFDDDIISVLSKETARELNEEVGLENNDALVAVLADKLRIEDYEFFYDESNDVGKVHLCISIVLYVNKKLVEDAEEEVITKGQWLSFSDIRTQVDNGELILETWSKIVLDLID
jgi:predicted NUDIX family phosphoesterase